MSLKPKEFTILEMTIKSKVDRDGPVTSKTDQVRISKKRSSNTNKPLNKNNHIMLCDIRSIF